MKHVFELHGKPQVTASVHAYGPGRVSEPPKWGGSRCEVLIVDCLDWDSDEHRREGDVIYIEGDTASVRRALQDALRMLDVNEQFAREKTEKSVRRSLLCPSCRAYADPMNQWHGDGKGKACYGLLDQRKALVAAEQPNIEHE